MFLGKNFNPNSPITIWNLLNTLQQHPIMFDNYPKIVDIVVFITFIFCFLHFNLDQILLKTQINIPLLTSVDIAVKIITNFPPELFIWAIMSTCLSFQ